MPLIIILSILSLGKGRVWNSKFCLVRYFWTMRKISASIHRILMVVPLTDLARMEFSGAVERSFPATFLSTFDKDGRDFGFGNGFHWFWVVGERVCFHSENLTIEIYSDPSRIIIDHINHINQNSLLFNFVNGSKLIFCLFFLFQFFCSNPCSYIYSGFIAADIVVKIFTRTLSKIEKDPKFPINHRSIPLK